MKLWGYRSTKKCPKCGHHCETAAYVTMCTSPSAIEQWKVSLETLGKDLAKRHTHPGLMRFLMSRLLEWKTRTPRKALRPMEHDLQELQDAQYDIGWDKFMFGNTSVLWQDKCSYPEYLTSGMGPTGTQECDPTQLRESHHTSRSSDDRISGPDGTGNWNTRTT
jgi:hypothetical protein